MFNLKLSFCIVIKLGYCNCYKVFLKDFIFWMYGLKLFCFDGMNKLSDFVKMNIN